MPPPRLPMAALSVRSFYDDSPPFTGLNADPQQEPVPQLDLDSPGVTPTDSAENSPPPSSVKDFAQLQGGMNSPRRFASHEKSIERLRPRSVVSDQARLGTNASVPCSPAPEDPQQGFSSYIELDKDPLRRSSPPLDLEMEARSYSFPTQKLATRMQDESKTPLVIVACGSFSPPTYLHLRMFEMAKDTIEEQGQYEILGGYYSPVSDRYKKAGLAPAVHRVRMCELAVDQTSSWLMVDPWEAIQPDYSRTAVVLDHFDEQINGNGGITLSDGTKKKIRIFLLAGGDLIESFGEPGVWAEEDLHIILGKYGCLIVERTGSDVWAFLLSHDILYQHRKNVIVVKQLIYNDISSTKVRLFVRRGMSIKYLLPNSVIQYIYDYDLYRSLDSKPADPPFKTV